jgi:hypothetical protein
VNTEPTVLAHGIGGRQDLPISLTELVIGAGLALVISFLVLGARWQYARLDSADTAGRPVPAGLARIVDSGWWAWTIRLLGLAAAGYFCIGLLGGPDTADNPTAGAFYVLFWVGLVPLSLALGPVWRALNPLRTVHLLGSLAARRDPAAGVRPLPAGLGYWPGAIGLLAFAWLELVAPDRATLPVIRVWLLVYATVTLAAAVIFGAAWFDRGDPFEVLSGLVGRLALIGRRRDGMLVWRNPLDGIAALRPAPGLVATVVVLLGSTMFDSLTGAPAWLRFSQENGVPRTVTGTGGLLAVIAVVAAAYHLATRTAGRQGRAQVDDMPGELAHSIVPIATGYLIAHYYSLLVLEGQRTIALLSDPLDIGANWLGTGSLTVHTGLITPAGVAALQVTLIVLGHLLGTVLAHDRALRLFPRAQAVRGQIPLLALMVAYTVAGLLLLFAG